MLLTDTVQVKYERLAVVYFSHGLLHQDSMESAPPLEGEPDGLQVPSPKLQAIQVEEAAPPAVIQQLVHQVLPAAGYGVMDQPVPKALTGSKVSPTACHPSRGNRPPHLFSSDSDPLQFQD